MRNIRFYTLHRDNKLPNIETVYYIIYLGKGIDVEKSRFQLTKTLKMNIMKHSTKKDRTDDSIKIWIRHFVRLHGCPNHPGKLKHSRFHTSHQDNKLPNTETLFNIDWLGKMNDGRK
jgi:hypothetical protein